MTVQKPVPPQRLSLHWGVDEDVEEISRYTYGGYHPIQLGDVLPPPADTEPSNSRKYRILSKLGHGSFSTVWLASAQHHSASGRYFAIKVCVANADPQRELDVFRLLSSDEGRHVLRLHDSFTIDGPNGTHAVHAFNVLGSFHIVARLARPHWNPRDLCRQIAQGLAFLHRHGVVHGDLHMGNIGVSMPQLDDIIEEDLIDRFDPPECTIVFPRQTPARPESLPPYLVPPTHISELLLKPTAELHIELLDLGNAIIVGSSSAPPACTPAAVCAPEIMFEQVTTSVVTQSATTASDIWALACIMYEIVFNVVLFHLASHDDYLLGKMAAVCGKVPPSWRSFWDSNEHLRKLDISQEAADQKWQRKIDNSSARKGGALSREDFVIFCDLLQRMLKIDPSDRLTIEEVLAHPWHTQTADNSI
ncbi:uncharacterized protein LACBIDRAFT_321041 [Laccaria bicolor S238N-H82]|uniref:Predicted protein n=1 Tax=Laccaria bicolor (strain S238N-H82 / ATCC MYA-4686) TaxID=486041 RepID=B0CNK3_LACBS|nr:uncharacterized protein LACBIDRAFT_321040 [Laccaria bicolor S238N-H82]XP_001874149.1 uncharacterized protein LACBIDRAFT_321041 [Laccaria bicolor S238N-H82]EDR15940.1 predicted protein [Laccaria bicolor S238N-H82]EDR15941.1 predicted protein [Laccaria bicolor S238N-H82]|eukprot:XP_001874148.1 predicted protein [Laccaria bicolor S238N-H82]